MTRFGWEPGTRTKLYYDCGANRTIEPDDLVASPAGASYLVVEARRSPSKPERMYLEVERLPYGSVRIGDEGVWPLFWYPR